MEVFLPWVGFFVLIFIFLILDLGVFNRTPHAISMGEALGASLGWITVSLLC